MRLNMLPSIGDIKCVARFKGMPVNFCPAYELDGPPDFMATAIDQIETVG
jgi:hypothetical protein